jgi:hypothetical protein
VDLAKTAHEAQEKVLILEAAPDVAMTEAEKLKQPVVLSVPVTTHSEHSTFIAGHEFVVLVQNAFDPKDLHLRQGVDIDRLNKVSEALWKNTKHRLDHHMQQKVTDLKRKSWVFKFVKENLGCASSAMTIMGHINMKRVLANNNKTCVFKNIGQPTVWLISKVAAHAMTQPVEVLFGVARSMERIGRLWPNTKNVLKLPSQEDFL